MTTRKRLAAVVVSSDSEGHSDAASNPPAGETASKRPRKLTTKAAAASEEENAKKQLAEFRRLKSQVKALKKKLNQQQEADIDDPQDQEETHADPDRLPPESEEEDEVGVDLSASWAHLTITVEIRRISTVAAKPPTQKIKPRIQRREGSVPPAPSLQPRPTSESVGGNSVSETGPARTQTTNSATSQGGAIATAEVNTMRLGWLRKSSTFAPLPTPAPSRATSTPAMHAQVSSPAPADPAPSSIRPAPFRRGVEPPSGARPKAEDYTDDVKGLLLDAIKHFSCYIYTKNAFPSDTQQDTFAIDAWKAACNSCEEPALYELSDRMKRIICARKSNARGDVSDEVRPHTAAAYGFREGTTTSNERHNVALYTKLIKDGAFHHKTLNDRTGTMEGFAGHPYISRVIQKAFFANTRTGTGFRFPEAFNPIPTETVALALTVIRAHIEEWSTGHHGTLKFSESEFAGTYKGLLNNLEVWVKGNEDVWLNIRKKWYRRAFTGGGGVMDESNNGRVSKVVLDNAREELKGRTGLTDSEDEGTSGEGASNS